MVDLFCTPFADMIQRMRLEFQNQQAIFDLPARKWYIPPTGPDAPGFVGPVSRSRRWKCLGASLGSAVANGSKPGALVVRRRANHGAQDGSGERRAQDLAAVHRGRERGLQHRMVARARVADSLDQYVQGAMLIHMLRNAPQVFGKPFGNVSLAGACGEPIYDMSIGYDLAGIQSPKVVNFIRGMIDASASVAQITRSNPALARPAARPRLPHRTQPQHYALHVPWLPGRRNRTHLRIPAHRT